MDIKLKFEGNKELKQFLKMGRSHPINKAMAQAVRRATKGVVTDSARITTRTYNLKHKDIKKRYKVNTKQVHKDIPIDRMQGTVSTNPKRIGYINFKPKAYGAPQGQRKAGGIKIKIRKRGGKKKMRSTFIKKIKGTENVYIRSEIIKPGIPVRRPNSGDQKLPITRREAFSITKLIPYQIPELSRGAEARISKEFPRNLKRQIERLKRRT